MGLLSVLKSLFKGGAAAPEAEELSEEYKGFQIRPAPIKEGDRYRVAAIISLGERTHRLIRADLLASRQECIELSLRKARVMIDQQGEALFG